MTCTAECTQFDLAMELLIEHGLEGIADCYFNNPRREDSQPKLNYY